MQIRVIDDTDCAITWEAEQKDLSPLFGKKVRLHIQAYNATSLFFYQNELIVIKEIQT